MSKKEYEEEFEYELSEEWHDGARFYFSDWNAFVWTRYNNFKGSEYA